MKRFFCFFLFFSLFFGTLAFAHGGRTDEYGGHHDYNNVSGLGSYHYHHGYEAHLHPDGICPYEAESSPVEPSEPIITDTDEIEEKFNSLLEEEPTEEPIEEHHTASNDLYEPIFLLCSIVGGIAIFYFIFIR